MEKIAVLSDIHGNILALERVLADLQARQITRVANLGDHLSGPLWPMETARLLMAQDWIQIRGNHDRQLAGQDPAAHNLSDHYAYTQIGGMELDWLRALPPSLTVSPGLLLIHGAPGSDTTYLLESVANGRTQLAALPDITLRLGPTRADLILCGHTHQPRVVRLPDGRVIANPGSVGLGAYQDDRPEYHVSETGSPHARYAVLEQTQSGWSVDQVSLPYDHAKAAEQARKNGRADWEIALRTGTMQP